MTHTACGPVLGLALAALAGVAGLAPHSVAQDKKRV